MFDHSWKISVSRSLLQIRKGEISRIRINQNGNRKELLRITSWLTFSSVEIHIRVFVVSLFYKPFFT